MAIVIVEDEEEVDGVVGGMRFGSSFEDGVNGEDEV